MTLQKTTGVVVFLDALGVSNYTQIDQFLRFAEELEVLKTETDQVWIKWKKDFEKDGIIAIIPSLYFSRSSLSIRGL